MLGEGGRTWRRRGRRGRGLLGEGLGLHEKELDQDDARPGKHGGREECLPRMVGSAERVTDCMAGLKVWSEGERAGRGRADSGSAGVVRILPSLDVL